MRVKINVGKIIERIRLGVFRHQPLVQFGGFAAVRRYGETVCLGVELPGIVDIPVHIGIVHVGVDTVADRRCGSVRLFNRLKRRKDRLQRRAVRAGSAVCTPAEKRQKHGERQKQRRNFLGFHIHHPFSYYTIAQRK